MDLSFAIMVKNEQEHLERCLTSLKSFNAEIIILDTGSTDNTIEIAKKFTDNIHHQEWANDFSLHRNKSFSLAHGDWIFQMDADEEIIFDGEHTSQTFIKFLKELPPKVTAVGFPLRDFRPSSGTYAAEFDVARCFRKGTVIYARKIHNRPDYEGLVTYFDAFFIKHYGYDLNKEQREAKSKRTIGLLLESIEKDPTDHESFFYLCQAYRQLDENNEKSIEYGLKYLDMMKDIPPENFNQSVFHTMAALYFENNDLVKSGEMIKRGLANNEKNPDLWFDTLKIAVKNKEIRAIAVASQQYITAIRNLRKIRTTTNLGGQFFFHTDADSVANGLYYLCMCYFENGVSELKNLKNIFEFCSPGVKDQIESRISEDMATLNLQGVRAEKIMISPDMAAMAFAGK